MQYKVIINGETVEVTFERTATGIEAEVGGRPYSLEVSTVKPGVFLLNRDSLSIEVSVLPAGDGFLVAIGSHRLPIEILDGRRLLRRKALSGDRDSALEIRSPMPGKIVRVLLTDGAEVTVGQGIVVMEAMKMQNEIKSPMSGRIQTIGVVEGETVRSGALIAIVEAVVRSE